MLVKKIKEIEQPKSFSKDSRNVKCLHVSVRKCEKYKCEKYSVVCKLLVKWRMVANDTVESVATSIVIKPS